MLPANIARECLTDPVGHEPYKAVPAEGLVRVRSTCGSLSEQEERLSGDSLFFQFDDILQGCSALAGGEVWVADNDSTGAIFIVALSPVG